MNDIITFDFDANTVRAVLIGDDPWWVANDVAQVLGYNRAPDMVRNLDDDEKGVHILHTLGGEQSLSIISESGLFAVILKSRKPEARRFRRWVTGEVLPALRRHGSYRLPGIPSQEDMPNSLLDSARLSASVATVREARRLFGAQSARVVWAKLGLPVPLADSHAGLEADPMAAEIDAYLATVESTTIEEAAHALGIVDPDGGMRLRIGALLRLFGWFPRKVRRGRSTVNLFTPALAGEA